MRGLIKFHKLTALLLGLWFVLIMISGLVLIFKSDVYALYAALVLEQMLLKDAALIESAYFAHQDICEALRIDHYVSSFSGAQVLGVRCDELNYLSIGGAASVPGSSDLVSFFTWVFNFHLELFMPFGRYVQAIAGAFLLSMSITGLLIWFKMPSKAHKKMGFRFKAPKPALYFQGHRAIGFWMVVLATPVVFMGVVLAAKGLVPLSQTIGPLEHTALVCAKRIECLNLYVAQNSDRVVKSVRQTAAKPDHLVILSQKQQAILGPKDVSTIITTANGRSSIARVTPRARTSWGKFVSWIYPLHTGQAFSLVGKTYVFSIGLGYLALMYFGYAFWYSKRKRGRR